METTTRILWTPKEGSSEEECQDAHSPPGGIDICSSESVQRFAISDGASEAMYSALWASLLVGGWTANQLGHGLLEAEVAALGDTWAERIESPELPWWAEAKLRQGSFATLLGLELAMEDAVSKWRVLAVGDSCFFLIRQGRVVKKGPVLSSEDFSKPPYLLGSLKSANSELTSRVFKDEGLLEPNDKILLMTDALACWTYRQIANDNQWPYLPLDGKDPRDDFRRWIAKLRAEREIRNDDVTLVSVAVTGISLSL